MNDRQLSDRCYLKCTLFDYQHQTVLWAYQQEQIPSASAAFWYTFTIGDHTCYYSPYFETIRLTPLPHVTGGMICEEMGLGKSIEILALINLNPSPIPSGSYFTLSHIDGLIASPATLIVATTSIVGQWINELKTKSIKPLNVLCWYNKRSRDQQFIANHDVVITTYAIVLHEAGGKDNVPSKDNSIFGNLTIYNRCIMFNCIHN